MFNWVILPIPSLKNHPARSNAPLPVLCNSTHSPSGRGAPSIDENGITSLIRIGEEPMIIESSGGGLNCSGVGYGAGPQ
ncbi:MAG: Uncharacterised protein [Methanobacteriota archaeon]|nr:MAG: Uncharacterised protein [Euryarchaeota archaeon]